MATSEVLTWLLQGDPSVRYVATRDLLGRDDPSLQARIATEGDGAVILSARGATGHWGRGFYQPKWTSSHYTLLQLCEIGLSPAHPVARATVQLILDTEKSDDGALNPSGGRAGHTGATSSSRPSRHRPSSCCGTGSYAVSAPAR